MMRANTIRPESAAPLLRIERGMGMLEALVAMTITTLVVGGLLTMLTGTQFVYSDLENRTSAQQAARISMDKMQRDVMSAGIGLTPIVPVFPLVFPRADGGIELRSNPTGSSDLLRADTRRRRDISINNTGAYARGNLVLLYDAAGAFDLVSITRVRRRWLRVTPRLSRNYGTSAGSAVARVEQIAYWTEINNGTLTLMRSLNNAPGQPIARDVVNFSIRYFDDSVPPVVFQPNTAVQQLRIRTVELSLTLETTAARLQAGDKPTFTLQTRVTPRALGIISG